MSPCSIQFNAFTINKFLIVTTCYSFLGISVDFFNFAPNVLNASFNPSISAGVLPFIGTATAYLDNTPIITNRALNFCVSLKSELLY